MKPEELTERLEKSFDNSPKDTIELLPKDLEDVLVEKIILQAEKLQGSNQIFGLEIASCAAIGRAFWAGHDYFKEYGELRGDHIDSI